MTESCSLGTWQYTPFGPLSRPLRDSLANVVTWTIPKVPPERLLLVRRKLNHQSGDSVQILGTLQPVDGIYGMVVMHEPRSAAMEFANVVRSAFSRAPLATVPSPDQDAEGSRGPVKAWHFMDYYDLVGAKETPRRPLPELVENHAHKCGLYVLGLWEVTSVRGVGTLNCMVAFALPEP